VTTPPLAGATRGRGTVIGLAVGAVLALAGLQFGIGGFLLVALLMAVGAFVGRALDGSIDVRGVVDALRGRSRGTS
jgi:hypothetical protein